MSQQEEEYQDKERETDKEDEDTSKIIKLSYLKSKALEPLSKFYGSDITENAMNKLESWYIDEEFEDEDFTNDWVPHDMDNCDGIELFVKELITTSSDCRIIFGKSEKNKRSLFEWFCYFLYSPNFDKPVTRPPILISQDDNDVIDEEKGEDIYGDGEEIYVDNCDVHISKCKHILALKQILEEYNKMAENDFDQLCERWKGDNIIDIENKFCHFMGCHEYADHGYDNIFSDFFGVCKVDGCRDIERHYRPRTKVDKNPETKAVKIVNIDKELECDDDRYDILNTFAKIHCYIYHDDETCQTLSRGRTRPGTERVPVKHTTNTTRILELYKNRNRISPMLPNFSQALDI